MRPKTENGRQLQALDHNAVQSATTNITAHLPSQPGGIPIQDIPSQAFKCINAEITYLARRLREPAAKFRFEAMATEMHQLQAFSGTNITDAIRRLTNTLSHSDAKAFLRSDPTQMLSAALTFTKTGKFLDNCFLPENTPYRTQWTPYGATGIDKKPSLDDLPPSASRMRSDPNFATPQEQIEFDEFLGELQEKEGRDLNEGVNTAQDVMDTAAEINATLVSSDRYSMPGVICELHSHQVLDIAWMVRRENKKESNGKRSKVRGGILAGTYRLRMSRVPQLT